MHQRANRTADVAPELFLFFSVLWARLSSGVNSRSIRSFWGGVAWGFTEQTTHRRILLLPPIHILDSRQASVPSMSRFQGAWPRCSNGSAAKQQRIRAWERRNDKGKNGNFQLQNLHIGRTFCPHQNPSTSPAIPSHTDWRWAFQVSGHAGQQPDNQPSSFLNGATFFNSDCRSDLVTWDKSST